MMSQSEIRLLGMRIIKLQQTLERHHVLLEELRTNGELTDEHATKAVACLHAYNSCQY